MTTTLGGAPITSGFRTIEGFKRAINWAPHSAERREPFVHKFQLGHQTGKGGKKLCKKNLCLGNRSNPSLHTIHAYDTYIPTWYLGV